MLKKFNLKSFATLVAIVVIGTVLLAACAPAAPAGDHDVPKPSNPGGPGAAVGLTGDATKGADVFKANCVQCHGEEGKGGVANPGSDDGTVPPLSPIDDALLNSDVKVYTENIDLFVEHGSTPAGSAPTLKMAAFGDQKTLEPQQIADVIAYVISLNK